MRLSESLTTTLKTAPKDAESANARWLIQGGFIDQLGAGIYSFLPLGLKVLDKISAIVRAEMNAIGAQEVLMPALHPKTIWARSGRWDTIDVMYKFKDSSKKEFALGTTHEEPAVHLAKTWIHSYKDLPKGVYQIQTKFRDEPRPRSGLLRGREFLMKDLYSFHTDQKDLETYYDNVIQAYFRIYDRIGLKDTRLVEASGGVFSKLSDEFQVFCDTGEDNVFYCDACEYAVNDEISQVKPGDKCPRCKKGKIKQTKSIEVGNVFKLGDNFSQAFDFHYSNPAGTRHPVVMGCYGLGISRVMGALAEVFSDAAGIAWPKAVSPADIHIVALGSSGSVKETAERLYRLLSDEGREVIYDDREESAGVKFADADIIGVPLRLTISDKTLARKSVELKSRTKKEVTLVELAKLQEALD